MAVSKLTFNGKTGNPSLAAPWVHALNQPQIVQEKAGFLFKASFEDTHLMLAVSPCIINGARAHHYDQHLDKEDAFTLIGFVGAQGVFTILIKPDSRTQAIKQSAEYIKVYRGFAKFLLESGYNGEGLLDEVTQGLLAKFDLNPAPQTLQELSEAT
jgi:hypothetical protein